MAVTIVDIARRVGVTPTTVSKVLNHSKNGVRISEVTRRKIMAAVKDLNYRPSFSARALRKGKTFSLGYLCGDIEMPYFSEMTNLALMEAEKRGYHLLVSLTSWSHQKELECLELLLQRGVDGALAHSTAFQAGIPLVEELRERKFPLVIITSSPSAFPSVASDWRQGMTQAVSYLREKGHKRIGYVTCDAHIAFERAPYSKFANLTQACTEQGIILERYELSINSQEARKIGFKLAKQPNCPGAFIVYSDYLAMSFQAGLQDAGLQIPRDAAVIGIDGTTTGGNVHPALTSVGQDMKQLIVQAIDIVLKMLDGKDVPVETKLIPTKLIVRQSA